MKLIRFIIFFLLINAVVSFLIVLNFKLAFGNPQTLKTLLAKSDSYNVVAASIRENIASANPLADQGNLLENLNDKVDPKGLQVLAEDLIDQVYYLKNPQVDRHITLHYSLLRTQLGPNVQLPEDKSYDVNEQPIVATVFAHSNTALAVSVLSILVLLLLHLKLIGKTRKQKLKWLGYNFLLISFELASLIAFLYYIIPNSLSWMTDKLFIESQKIAIGVSKAINAILAQQQTYYYIELGLFILAAVILWAISKAMRENLQPPKENNLDLHNLK